MKNIEVVKLHKDKVVIVNHKKKKFLIMRNYDWKLFNKSYELIDENKLEFTLNETISKMTDFNLSSNPLEDMYLKINYILKEYELKILDDNDLELDFINSQNLYTFKIVPKNISKVNKKYFYQAKLQINPYSSSSKADEVEKVEDLSFYPFIISFQKENSFIKSSLLEMEDYEFDYHIRKGTSLGKLLDFDYKKSKEIVEKIKDFINNNYKLKKTQNFHKKWKTTILFKDEVLKNHEKH